MNLSLLIVILLLIPSRLAQGIMITIKIKNGAAQR